MVYRADVLSVMIASPSDVEQQREDIRAVLNNWNFVNGYLRKVIFMPVGWETHAAPDLGGRAQGLINDRLLADCDLLVGVFWTKLGTPTGQSESGTVEEISRHVEAGKPAMVYFSDAPVAPQSIDLKQFAAVQAFKASCLKLGLVANFSNASHFRSLFENQLQIQLNTNPYLKALIAKSGDDEQASLSASELSADAKELLLAAVEEVHGYVLSTFDYGGRQVQVGGRSFAEPGDARSAARWEAALNELIDLSYLVPRGSKREMFQVSNTGYMCADRIKGHQDG